MPHKCQPNVGSISMLVQSTTYTDKSRKIKTMQFNWRWIMPRGSGDYAFTCKGRQTWDIVLHLIHTVQGVIGSVPHEHGYLLSHHGTHGSCQLFVKEIKKSPGGSSYRIHAVKHGYCTVLQLT